MTNRCFQIIVVIKFSIFWFNHDEEMSTNKFRWNKYECWNDWYFVVVTIVFKIEIFFVFFVSRDGFQSLKNRWKIVEKRLKKTLISWLINQQSRIFIRIQCDLSWYLSQPHINRISTHLQLICNYFTFAV